MKIQDKQLWYGYLEAVKKSTAVLLDRSLNTGNSDTLYLFNLTRGEILEYSRKIVEPKLRELKGKEPELTATLTPAYETARSHFTPRATDLLDLPDTAAPAKKAAPAKAEEDVEVESLVATGDLGQADSEWEEDEEDEDEEAS